MVIGFFIWFLIFFNANKNQALVLEECKNNIFASETLNFKISVGEDCQVWAKIEKNGEMFDLKYAQLDDNKFEIYGTNYNNETAKLEKSVYMTGTTYYNDEILILKLDIDKIFFNQYSSIKLINQNKEEV